MELSLAALAKVAIAAYMIALLVRRRPWFKREVRYWAVAWWACLSTSLFAMVLGLAELAGVHDRFERILLLLVASSGALVLTLMRENVVVPAQRRVLVVAAHPDDLELAAGGSVARFADRGHDVRAVVLSDGSRGGDAAVRPREAQEASQFLGLRDIQLHRYSDTRMGDEMEAMIGSIEVALAEFEPDVVLTHSVNDQHQDHHAVHLATLRAGRRVPTILCFESPSVTAEFTPRFFVDVSDHLEAKIGAIRWHANQLGKPYMDAEEITGRAAHRGAQAKVRYAEGFEVVRALSSSLGDL